MMQLDLAINRGPKRDVTIAAMMLSLRDAGYVLADEVAAEYSATGSELVYYCNVVRVADVGRRFTCVAFGVVWVLPQYIDAELCRAYFADLARRALQNDGAR